MGLTNTKVLFTSLMKVCETDCICDIGSCDGSQALLFRDVRPDAAVLAFEANPANFRAMQASGVLRARGIEIFPFAVSNRRGTARFLVSDVDYADPAQNRGTSSLFAREGLKVRESVEVETRRIDDLIREICPQARRIGLWVDVEGAEYLVLEGMAGIRDHVVAVHVETAETLMRQGQRTLAELRPLMEQQGFELRGSNIPVAHGWGDVVFVRQKVARELGWRLRLCLWRAGMSYWLRADPVAVFLKRRWPWLYRNLRAAYVRFGT